MTLSRLFARNHLALHLLHLSARQRLLVAAAVGVLGWLLLPARIQMASRLVASWDLFCLCILVLLWAGTHRADAAHLRRLATRQDPGRTWTFVAVLLGTSASLLAVVLLLSGLPNLHGREALFHVLLSVGAVAGSWLLLHSVFALRYAHAYFSEDETTAPPDVLGGWSFQAAHRARIGISPISPLWWA